MGRWCVLAVSVNLLNTFNVIWRFEWLCMGWVIWVFTVMHKTQCSHISRTIAFIRLSLIIFHTLSIIFCWLDIIPTIFQYIIGSTSWVWYTPLPFLNWDLEEWTAHFICLLIIAVLRNTTSWFFLDFFLFTCALLHLIYSIIMKFGVQKVH